jgi:hypothetical protein
MAKWLSGGRSTTATVQTAIDKFKEQWRTAARVALSVSSIAVTIS